MKYGHEVDNVKLLRDCWAEHFAEPGDIKSHYMVDVCGETISEGQDPQAVGKDLKKIIKRLDMIANFLLKIKVRK